MDYEEIINLNHELENKTEQFVEEFIESINQSFSTVTVREFRELTIKKLKELSIPFELSEKIRNAIDQRIERIEIKSLPKI